MRGRGVQADDMDRVLAAPDSENVFRVRGVPEGGGVPDVRLAGQEEFESDVFRARGVGEEFVGFVVGG